MRWLQQLNILPRIVVLASAVGAIVAMPRTGSAQNAAIQEQLTSPAASVSSVLGTESPYLGGVPTGIPTGTILQLSLSDALDRGLKYNLGLIESDVRTRSSRAERLKSLNELLPNVGASISQTAEQVNLKALGFRFGCPRLPRNRRSIRHPGRARKCLPKALRLARGPSAQGVRETSGGVPGFL